MKERIDKVLFERGLTKTRSQAQHYLEQGNVYLNGEQVFKSSLKVDEKDNLEIRAEQFVGRGAVKLEAAIFQFQPLIKDQVLMDVGASTGGFSEILLKHNALKIYAIDVGSDQLDDSLINNSKIINKEKTHILHVKKEDLAELPQGFVIDLSFISLTKILNHLTTISAQGAWVIALVKPQFEIGSTLLPKDGVLKDEKLRQKVLNDLKEFVIHHGWTFLGVMDSPILGKSGNKEYFMYFRF